MNRPAPTGGTFLQKLLLMGFGIVFALGLLEVALRIHNPMKFRVRGNRIVLPANQDYSLTNDRIPSLDRQIIHRKNSLGFRGPEPPADFASELTLLTVGGSTTECFYLSDGRTWPDDLARRLSGEFDRLWLDNAGLDGHSTFGHGVLLSDYIVPLRPKVVLFLIGVNDVGLDAPKDYDRNALRHGWSFASPAAFGRSLADQTEVGTLILNIVRNIRARRAHLAHTDLDLAHAKTLAVTPEMREKTLAEHEARYLPEFEKRVRHLLDLCRGAGIRPVLITQPLLFGSVIDSVTGVDLGAIDAGRGMNGALFWELLERYNDVTRRVAAESGVALVDLAHEMPKDSRCFYDSAHFNNAGAERVAEIVDRDLAPQLREWFPDFVKRPN
jgi:lysophospholipase L1-like esterase